MCSSVRELCSAISCHSWNADRSLLAFCPHNSEIRIVRVDAFGGWSTARILTGHNQLVSGLGWAPVSNLLVSVSHDRSSFVWRLEEDGNWRPLLVLTRLNRAALCVQWSRSENKFAIGSGAKVVCVCYYERENDWWVSKRIKQHSSSVVCVAWHPSDALLATTSTDMKCRIFNAALAGIDDAHSQSLSCTQGTSFGDCLFEITMASGWPHAVAWSPDGTCMAIATHASEVCMLSGFHLQKQGPLHFQERLDIPLKSLPCVSLLFLSNHMLVGGGFDGHPVLLFNNGEGLWRVRPILHCSGKALAKETAVGIIAAKVEMFEISSEGPGTHRSQLACEDNEMNSPHENCIVGLQPFAQNEEGIITQFSSAGLDGRVAIWDTQAMDTSCG